MIEETLGLTDDALDSWKQFLKLGDSDAFCRGPRTSRIVSRTLDPTTQWETNRTQLPAALRAHDRVTVAKLVAPFPTSAEKYLEEELLKTGIDRRGKDARQ